MPDQTIKCPKCGIQIELTEALTGQIEQSIRAKYEAVAVAKERELAAKAEVIKKQEKDLAAQKQAIEEQVAEKVKAERKIISEQERVKIIAEQAEQSKALQGELEAKSKELAQAKRTELELRQQRQKLEEEKQSFELTIQRKIDEERKKITEEAGKKAIEEQLLKLREKDDLIRAMQGQIEALKQRAEQGSQEAQGEAFEGALLDSLKQTFPFDQFEEVKKGQRGADIVQVVRNNNAKECGKIVWESKYTKTFAGGWIAKLKSDQQEAGAEIAVLATIALPKEIKNFGQYEGVWVTDFASAMGLAAALRMVLINAAREKLLATNQETAKDWIYRYVTGQEFAMQIRAIAEAFGRMKMDLDSEKRAMEKIWKSREKQIETVLSNVAGIRGSLEGYVGKALPPMETLTLEGIGGEGQ